MLLLKRTSYISTSDLGSDNVLMINTEVGPYLMKCGDFMARKTGVPVSVYPVVEDTKTTGMVPVYSAVLADSDYESIVEIPIHPDSLSRLPAS